MFQAIATKPEFLSDEEKAIVEAEQLRAFFSETNEQNVAGVVVMSLLVWVAHAGTTLLSWLLPLVALYAISIYRYFDIRDYQKSPLSRSTASWRARHIFLGGLVGVFWGTLSTLLLRQVAVEYQLLILTVITVSASTNSGEGYAFPGPSRAFILCTLIPPTIWLFTVSDSVHQTLGVMLCVFIPMTLWLGEKRSRIFVEAQQLRFRNELLAQELARQCDISEQASLSKGRFLAAASHDLRQPMQALTIFHELLEQEALASGSVSENLQNAQKAAKSVRMLLDSLLDISKLDAEVIKPTLQVLPVETVLDEILRDFSPLAQRKGLQLRVRACDAFVVSDAILLSRLLRNLVSNAIRYTERGKVLLACRRRGERLDVRVIDTGVGIAPEHQQEVFSEFYQVANKARDRNRGLGLGLAIVDRLATLLEHPLTLKSVVGRGTSFTLSLPIAAAPVTTLVRSSSLPSSEAQTAMASGKHLLIVEDDEAVRLGLSKLAEGWGYQVLTAASGDEALSLVVENDLAVDVLMTDMNLPGTLDGFRLVAALRQHHPDLPALLVTGDTTEPTLQAARAANLLIVHKPVRPARLRVALGRVISA